MKIGIIGLGYMGKHHLKLLHQMVADKFLNDTAITGIADVNAETTKTLAEKYHVPHWSMDPAEILSTDVCDAVFIASPPQFHKEQALLALKSGKAVYCEKPLGKDLAEVLEMAKMAREFGLPNQSGLVLRHSPSCCEIKAMLESGLYGKPQRVIHRHDTRVPAGGIYTGSMSERFAPGRGILRECNIHDIDLLMFLLGEFELDTVRMGFDDADIDISARCTFRFKNGAEGLFETLFHDIEGRGTSRRLEIFCEKGLIIAEDFLFNGDIRSQISGKELVAEETGALFAKHLKRVDLPEGFRRYRQWYSSLADHHFCQSVMNGKTCEPSFDDSLAAEKKVHEIYSKAGAAL